MSIAEVNSLVTPALHPSNIEHITGYNDDTRPYLGLAMEAMDTAYQAIAKVHAARVQVSKNEAWTPENKIILVADFADKHMSAATKKIDQAVTAMSKTINSLDSQLNSPVIADAERLKVSGEVRDYFRSLNTEQRHSLLMDSIERLDHVTLRSVLGGPFYLSGLTEELQKVYTRQYHVKANPEIANRLEVLTAAREMFNTRSGLLFSEMEKAIGANYRKVQQLREATNSATSALRFE